MTRRLTKNNAENFYAPISVYAYGAARQGSCTEGGWAFKVKNHRCWLSDSGFSGACNRPILLELIAICRALKQLPEGAATDIYTSQRAIAASDRSDDRQLRLELESVETLDAFAFSILGEFSDLRNSHEPLLRLVDIDSAGPHYRHAMAMAELASEREER
jgi:hypothetical protein